MTARREPKRVLVTEDALKERPCAIWNAFIDIIAVSFPEELSPLQREAQLVFRYESEVQNGGHLQFFTNGSGEEFEETVRGLNALGALAQARVLERAIERWTSVAPRPPANLEEYSAMERTREFLDLDDAFSDCPLSLTAVLERHLAEHEAEYVESNQS